MHRLLSAPLCVCVKSLCEIAPSPAAHPEIRDAAEEIVREGEAVGDHVHRCMFMASISILDNT
jgi:hypothetical protein